MNVYKWFKLTTTLVFGQAALRMVYIGYVEGYLIKQWQKIKHLHFAYSCYTFFVVVTVAILVGVLFCAIIVFVDNFC